MEQAVICWFKRDLRIADHPALTCAAGLGRVIALYILEPELWRQPDASGRQFAFLSESLAELRRSLAQMGVPLVVRVGEAVDVLESLRRAHGVTDLISHEETGNAWTYARDRAIAVWARGQGVRWQELPQCGVVRRLASRNDWQGARDRFMRAPVLTVPHIRPVAGVHSDAWRDARDMGLHDACPGRQTGGRSRGLRALDSFLTVRGEPYQKAMSSPVTGPKTCSRISPHLAFGTLSVREAVHAADKAPKGRGKAWAGSMRAFHARLAWRDHFIQKLEDEPGLELAEMHPAYAGLRPVPSDAARLEAWAKGETGLPFVDACMRSLQATGWINFRMRAMLMAVASYHLWLDWRDSGAVLARAFTDYEPGIHWSQVQMQSGTTGMNTPRIYNPVKQGHDHDADGAFIRRWVPELEAVPAGIIHEPWKWDGARALAYPAPVVEPVAAAKAAREAIWAVRRTDGFAEAKAQVIARHASRKRPRRPARDTRQMSFDL